MHTEFEPNLPDISMASKNFKSGALTLNQALAELVLSMEEKSERPLFGSVLLVDEAGKRLYRGAAPSLPESYCSHIEGIEVGPNVGSCGTAVFCGHPIYVVDIETDPRWANFRDAALSHGLKACWSMPIFASSGKILGSIAVYYKMARSANDSERLLVSHGAIEAAKIIESYTDTRSAA